MHVVLALILEWGSALSVMNAWDDNGDSCISHCWQHCCSHTCAIPPAEGSLCPAPLPLSSPHTHVSRWCCLHKDFAYKAKAKRSLHSSSLPSLVTAFLSLSNKAPARNSCAYRTPEKVSVGAGILRARRTFTGKQPPANRSPKNFVIRLYSIEKAKRRDLGSSPVDLSTHTDPPSKVK